MGRVLAVRRVRAAGERPLAGQCHRVRDPGVAGAGQGPDPGERDRARGRARAGRGDRGPVWLPDRQGQGGRARAGRGRRHRAGGGGPGGPRPGGQDPGRRQRRLGPRPGGPHAAAAGGVRAGVRRAALRHPGRTGRTAPAHRHPGRRRRVHPPGRGPAAGPGGGRGRHRDGEGPAARRGPRGAGRGGGLRPARGGVQRRRHLGRAGRRGGAGRGASRAALRLRAGHDVAARRGRHGQAADPRGRGAAGAAPGGRPGTAGPLGDRSRALAGTGRGGRALSARRGGRAVNPSTAFGTTFGDELIRCGLREVVLAPGSRSTPLAMAFGEADQRGRIRLHVRIDERSASFTALGLAKASRRPVAVLCTSGTAAANFHPAVIEASESAVPVIVLTADRPPELRGTGANQTIDQIKLYGSAVRWFCEAGTPEARPGMGGYWRSLACRAWAHAAGLAGGLPGPVHLNLPLRDPLVPDGDPEWPESLDGRPDGRPWTRFAGREAAGGELELPWTERGVVVCGDGDYDALALVELAGRAGWPVLAEPSSGARRGPNALAAYQYLLAVPEFIRGHRPDLIVSAGRPGLSRGQTAFLKPGSASRHVVVTQGPGQWADPQRAATDVAARLRLTGTPPTGKAGSRTWLGDWRRADEAAASAADAILDAGEDLTEPRLARDLVAALPGGALLWIASSQPVRDIDGGARPRADLHILASRGASGIDGTASSAIGAALAHGGPAYALIGDLALVHDAPGLALGPREPRPDLCLIVVSNDGGGIFSHLEPAAFPASFERLFGTPHGLRIVEARTDRAAAADLRSRLRAAAAAAIREL